jgi:hypothetical protein
LADRYRDDQFAQTKQRGLRPAEAFYPKKEHQPGKEGCQAFLCEHLRFGTQNTGAHFGAMSFNLGQLAVNGSGFYCGLSRHVQPSAQARSGRKIVVVRMVLQLA